MVLHIIPQNTLTSNIMWTLLHIQMKMLEKKLKPTFEIWYVSQLLNLKSKSNFNQKIIFSNLTNQDAKLHFIFSII